MFCMNSLFFLFFYYMMICATRVLFGFPVVAYRFGRK